jgi:hypothetical protein
MALPPTPNFESAAFRQDVEMRLKEGVLPPLLERLARWKKQNRSYLFAGVCVGWESGIPDYRTLRQAPVMPRDEQRKITMTEEERGVQFGYASLYARGWTQEKIQDMASRTGKSVEDVTTELLFQVIHDYTSFWAKTVQDAGIPKERIYTHGVAWESVPDQRLPGAWMRKSSRVPPIWVNVNAYSRPGYTAGAGQFDLEELVRLLRAAGAPDGWGAVEAYVRGVESQEAFGGYLRQFFESGAHMVDIFGWTAPGSPYDPKRAPGALRSIHSWLEGKELPQASAQTMQAQGIAPGAVPQSLQQKMHELQALVEKRQQGGADLQPVGDLMQGFQPLMQQQKFTEAEALLDRALKRAGELTPPSPQQAGPPPWLQETMRRVKKPTADDPDYLIYQFMGDPQHPDQAGPWVEKLQAEFGRQKPGQSKYVGFGFFIQDMNGDVPSLRRKIETLLGIAEKYEMPVFFQLDGTLFWDKRPDDLNTNPEAVEWSAFPAPGQKTGPIIPRIWFNWGDWTAFPVSPPCFESSLFRADVKERLEKAVAAPIREALERWRTGGVDRTYLFAGATVGNEVGIPDYRFNKIQLERNPASRPRDKGKGLEMTDAEMVRGGYCSLYNRGYTAEKISEIVRDRFGADDVSGMNTETVVTGLLDDVVHDYMAFRAKILWDNLAGSGPAQMRIYTHTTSTARKKAGRSMAFATDGSRSIPTVAAAVNPYSRPGFSVVRNSVDLPDVLSQMRAAAGGAANSWVVPWGAVESYATVAQPGRPQTQEEYRAYLDMLFGSGAKLVSLLESPQGANSPFTVAAESAGVKSAIREWLRR